MDRLQWRSASQGFEARDRKAVKFGQDLAPMDGLVARGSVEARKKIVRCSGEEIVRGIVLTPSSST